MSSMDDGRGIGLRHWPALAAAWMALLALSCMGGQRGVPATHGIANFGQVSATLYRGGQPDEQGMENLQRLGVATIISLRMPDDTWPGEADSVRRHGLDYHQVPLHGFSAPTDAEVAQVLALIASSRAPVFIHCEHGADRTGTIAACDRIRFEGWTAERALAEAKHYGFSGWEFGMKRFVRDFPAKVSPAKKPPG